MMHVRFVEVDGHELALEYVMSLGYEREAQLLTLLEFLEDMTDESRLPFPMFVRLRGKGTKGFWRMTADVGSETYLFIVRRVGNSWYVVLGLSDPHGIGVPATERARAIALWAAFAPQVDSS
jgi:hypothetical protein